MRSGGSTSSAYTFGTGLNLRNFEFTLSLLTVPNSEANGSGLSMAMSGFVIRFLINLLVNIKPASIQGVGFFFCCECDYHDWKINTLTYTAIYSRACFCSGIQSKYNFE